MTTDPKLAVDLWNGAHPVGTPVRYWSGADTWVRSRTSGPAYVVGRVAAIRVEGRSIPVALSHVSLVVEEQGA